MIRYRRDMTPEEQLDVLLDGLTSRQCRSVLRHPGWWDRCDCGRYGRPYGTDLVVIDHDTTHARHLCQPTREFIHP